MAGLWSDNPGKRAAERWYLLYTPVWGGVSALVMVTGIGVRWSQQPWGDLAFFLYGLGLWAGVVAGGYVFRAPEDAGRPWYRLYHTKFQIWMFVFAFLGNYFTEYFYEVLHMQYGFETRWNLNDVPFFLYMVTVAYFSTYGTLLNVCRRLTDARLPAAAPAWVKRLSYLPACFVVAGLETALNANPFMQSLFCYDDMSFMLWFGTLMYGLWFVVTAPLWFAIDEKPGADTPLREVWLTALSGFMLVIVVNEGIRELVAPHFTTVERGFVGMNHFEGSCLVAKDPGAGLGFASSPLPVGRGDVRGGDGLLAFLAQIGGAAYCISALVIGVRLLWLSARTRHLPELMIGGGILLLAGLGYPLSAVARETPDLAGSTRAAIGAGAAVLSTLGLGANTGFIWLLFRRHVAWGTGLLAAVGLGSVGLFVAQSLAGGWAQGAIFWAGLPLLITVSFGWGFVECGLYHLALRRRLRLGMADVVVTNRFGLYAIATGLAVVTNVAGTVFWHLGVEMITDPVGGLLLFGLGTGSSTLMLLAFLAPPAYVAWLRGRTPAAA